jgi:NitT/TauT family transport system permease protein
MTVSAQHRLETLQPSAGPHRRHRGSLTVPAGSVALAVFAVLMWWLASTLTFVVPSPAATVVALVESLTDPDYLVHLQATSVAALLALVASVAVGIAVGLALGMVPWLHRGFAPLVVALNGLPKIVLYPVLLLMFGMGTSSKVVLGALIGMFPVLMNVTAGVRDVPAIYSKLARTLEASKWQQFTMVLLPAIRRSLMTGVRLAVSLSVVGVVLAEMFATQYGLGRVILSSYTAGQYARMLATVLLLGIVSFLLTVVLWRVERRLR